MVFEPCSKLETEDSSEDILKTEINTVDLMCMNNFKKFQWDDNAKGRLFPYDSFPPLSLLCRKHIGHVFSLEYSLEDT